MRRVNTLEQVMVGKMKMFPWLTSIVWSASVRYTGTLRLVFPIVPENVPVTLALSSSSHLVWLASDCAIACMTRDIQVQIRPLQKLKDVAPKVVDNSQQYGGRH